MRCRACFATDVAAISCVRFWVRVLWIRQGIRNKQWFAFLARLSFMQLLRSGLAHKKTPLKKPVALADRRKSSIF
jgi:hypothetical protein